MIPEYTYTLNNNELSKLELEQIDKLLMDGGLCLLPSDSSYVLTGLPTINGVTRDLDLILAREKEPMSLAFNSMDQVATMLQLSNMAYDFIKSLTPGAITFVARLSENAYEKLSEKRLFADGTIGVRITGSKVETQLAKNFPLPTTPIRNANKAVATADEAVKVVAARLEQLSIHRRIAVIVGEVEHPGILSTVVKEESPDGLWKIKMIRSGLVPESRILEVAQKCQYDGIFW